MEGTDSKTAGFHQGEQIVWREKGIRERETASEAMRTRSLEHVYYQDDEETVGSLQGKSTTITTGEQIRRRLPSPRGMRHERTRVEFPKKGECVISDPRAATRVIVRKKLGFVQVGDKVSRG